MIKVMNMDTGTADQIFSHKASIYNFLSEVFSSHPTPEIVRGVCQMAQILKMPAPEVADLGALDHEYMAMFVVPNPRYVAPYESVFRERWLIPQEFLPGYSPQKTSVMIKGLVMGETTLQVLQAYIDAGVLLTDDLPDHISNELRFMAYLWEAAADESPDDLFHLSEMRSRFCAEHLLKWVSELQERILESDHLGFYMAAVQVMVIVLKQEPAYSQESVQRV
jgi:TorA maturation chaperone TorD